MGLVATRDLVGSELVEKVILGDVETSRAKTLIKELGSDKVGIVNVDATRPENLVNAIRGSNVLINAIWYEYNLDVMRAAIEAKVNYVDLGGLFHMTRRQMELNDPAQRAGVTAVLGGGESPGITNVMCAASAEKLDSVEEIRIRVGAAEKPTSESEKLVFPFAISTIFDEYSETPVMYLNGRFQEVPPLSGEEEVEFPQPVGRNMCHYSIHSEIATLPLSFRRVKNVDFKLGVSEKLFKAVKPFVDAGMADTTPIKVERNRISPRDFAIAYLTSRASDEEPSRYVALKTVVEGLKNGKKIRHICDVIGGPSEEFGVKNATGLLTGVGVSIVAQFILEGRVEKKGVVAPEICVPAEALFTELNKRGIKVTAYELKLAD